jgi:release factor glutamine methyltransferase
MTIAAFPPSITIAAARRRLAQAFRDSGCDSPELDARLLAGHALGLEHAALAASEERRLTAQEIEAITALAVRRCAREPVARILGVKEFWGLPLQLSAETLVPRPETETLVEAALDVIGRDAAARARPLLVADLGTGSGALLLALLSELPQAEGIGTDVSIRALGTARENAAQLGLSARARFAAGDFGAALRGGFGLVVSNPPYIASGEMGALAPEVREHDPRAALDGGPDGLAAYRSIASDASRLLAPGGWLVLETGAGQADAVAAFLRVAGLATAEKPRRDLAGIPRAVLARASP